MEAKENQGIALELGRAMNEFRNQLRKIIQVKLKEHGINMTFEMLEVMSCLWKEDGINQQEIADITLRDKSSMTYLLDNLVKRKMIERGEDENDRRNKLIRLTREGRQLREQLQPWATEIYAMAAGDIPVAELQEGLALLNRMTSNIKPAY